MIDMRVELTQVLARSKERRLSLMRLLDIAEKLTLVVSQLEREQLADQIRTRQIERELSAGKTDA